MVDFHSHLLPELDDGSSSLEETRAALTAFAEQGFGTLVTTPHLRASELGGPEAEAFFARLEDRRERVRAMMETEFPGLSLRVGVELNLDVPSPDIADPRVRLDGTRAVLIEFPFFTVPPNAVKAIFDLRIQGWTPIVAHPERYANLAADLSDAGEWRRVGGYLQVNAGSFLGKYGREEQRRAWGLLRRGWADYVCSDHHARGTLHARAAREAIESAGGAEQASLLFEVNPERMLAGATPLPVAPLKEGRSGAGQGWRRWIPFLKRSSTR
jgi:protein-tyrosine phosphatase